MIERFRRKFIIVATASIFALLTLILGAVNIANFTQLANTADEVTSLLAQSGGVFEPDGGGFVPPTPPEGEPTDRPEDHGPGDFINPETKMSTRYFTVAVDADGSTRLIKMAMEPNTCTEERALVWATELVDKPKGWTETYFRFRSYAYENQRFVSVIHYGRELAPSYTVLWGSLIGGAVGTLIALIALIPVSKILVKPLSTSIKKQQRFISDASHELKTPITIISANNEIIEVESGESEATRSIAKQVDRLTALVKNLNTLARLDEGEEKPVADTLNLAAISAEVVTSFEGAFKGKNIAFSAEIPGEIQIHGDEAMFKKLLSILLDNALKYALTTAEFHLYKNGDRVAIKVINDAEGLEEDGSLDRVFERFYRSDAARASNVEGSGIGLSIAKEIVARHNGRISAKAQGGKFVIKAEL